MIYYADEMIYYYAMMIYFATLAAYAGCHAAAPPPRYASCKLRFFAAARFSRYGVAPEYFSLTITMLDYDFTYAAVFLVTAIAAVNFSMPPLLLR